MSTFTQALAGVLALMIFQQVAGRNRWLSRPLFCLACLTGPLLFACLLIGTRPAAVDVESKEGVMDFQHSGSLFVTFVGLQKRLKNEFRFGGADDSDFLLDRVPGNVASIDVNGVLSPLTVDAQGDYFSVTKGDMEELVERGTVPTWELHSGSSFCFGRPGTEVCDADRSWIWSLDQEGRLNVRQRGNGSEVPACVLKQFIRAFAVQALMHRIPTARDRVFPLDIYGRPDCAGVAVELDAESTLRQTFLHFDARGRLYVSQLPAGEVKQTLVVEQGQRVAPAEAASPSIAENFRLTVFRLQTSSPLQEVELREGLLTSSYMAETGRSRLMRIASTEVEFRSSSERATGPDIIRVMAVQPQVAEVPSSRTCRQSTIVNVVGARERARPRTQESEVPETTVRVPFLSDMGQIGATGALFEIQRSSGPVSPWQAHGCRSFSRANISLSGASGTIDEVQGSDLLSVGSTDQGLLLISAAEYGVAGVWILGLLLSAAALRIAVRWTWWSRLSHATLVSAVLIVVDTLLLLRLMVAIQEIAVRPHLGSNVPGALLALLAIPLLLDVLIVALNRSSGRARKLISLGYLLPWTPGRPTDHRHSSNSTSLRTSALILAIPVLHLALVLSGTREQIGGIRLTAVFVPAYVVLFAVIVAASWARRPWTPLQRHSWIGLLICGALAVLAFAVARDIGAVITLVGALLALTLMATAARDLPGRRLSWFYSFLAYGVLVLAALTLSAWLLLYVGGYGLSDAAVLQRHPALASIVLAAIVIGIFAVWRWRTTAGWLFAAPGAFVLLVLLGISTSRFDQQSEDCTDRDLRQVALCLDRYGMDTNRLRLSYLLYPQLTRLNLTGEARGMNSVFDELRWLTTEFKGQGFMGVPPRLGLDEHDNAIATHLIGPQGRASAAILCALLTFPLIFFVASSHHRRAGLRRPLVWLAYACLAFTSVYMVLGNLLLVPFTGRNVYLTNPLSGTDLLEGGLLVLFVVVPLACARRRESREH